MPLSAAEVNRASSLALRKRFSVLRFRAARQPRRTTILLFAPEQRSFPLAEDIFDFLHPDTVESVLVQPFCRRRSSVRAFGGRRPGRWRCRVTRPVSPRTASPSSARGGGPARGCLPGAARVSGQPRRRRGRAAGPPAGQQRRSRTVSRRRSMSRPARACSGRSGRANPHVGARRPRAVTPGACAAELAAVHLPGRRSAGGEAGAGGPGATIASRRGCGGARSAGCLRHRAGGGGRAPSDSRRGGTARLAAHGGAGPGGGGASAPACRAGGDRPRGETHRLDGGRVSL